MSPSHHALSHVADLLLEAKNMMIIPEILK
jgi:hypothetical protein